MGAALQLLERLEALGIELSCKEGKLHYIAPKGVLDHTLRDQLVQHKAALLALLETRGLEDTLPSNTAAAAREGEPFAMSPLQQAYWIGETSLYGTACIPYLYSEYIVERLRLDDLLMAVNELVRRHGALRLRSAEDGTQLVLPHAPYRATVVDLRGASTADVQQAIADHRARLEDRLRHADRPFEFTVLRFAGRDVVSFAFKLATVDGVSFNLLLEELIDLYEGRQLAPRSSRSYADYIRHLEKRRASTAYRKAQAYWAQRLVQLPLPPALPYLERESKVTTRFERLSGSLPPEVWQGLKAAAQQRGLPVNSVLCCIYSDVLSRWSTSPAFTLNVLLSDRPSLPGMDTLVGNCSTTMLLEVQHHGKTFVERAKALQAQIFQDMEHACVAGVDLIRQMQARQGASSRPPMPVVFTSGIGLSNRMKGFVIRHPDWEYVHGHLKTPQVWLDHQVYEDEGKLVFNWDHVSDAFPPGLVQTMFDAYEAWLMTLSEGGDAWSDGSAPQMPDAQAMLREKINSRYCALPQGLLHERFVLMAQQRPQAIALIGPDGSTTYGQLHEQALGIGLRIRQLLGTESGQVIGVLARKGRAQIASVLGVLLSGNVYLPLDAKLPEERVRHIVSHSDTQAVLVDGACHARLSAPLSVPVVPVDDGMPALGQLPSHGVSPNDPAYIIYTSGSTGQPKGVVISHGAAMNTLDDMVRRFGLAPQDIVLGLSSLNFDLSVYDVFATLSHGATLMLPPEQEVPDPNAWLQLVMSHGVTVWNSVPALMEVSLEHLGEAASETLASLRTVLLSGDWIPLKLVSSLKRFCPQAQLVSLGGATEASIWSNFHRITSLLPGWSSVPYGTPLSNQSMHVLDEKLAHCPDWVTGDLYIGGVGLAEGYLNETEKTAASFFVHPAMGERLYKTGDIARFRDGMIEFLGRKDFQVKIRGYRVELGEIEAKMNEFPGVDASVAVLDGRDSAAQRLVLFYTTHAQAALEPDRIHAYLARHLPHYMVPAVLQFIDRIPLSANAKVDRQRLLAQLPELAGVADVGQMPCTDTERMLAEIWQSLLGLARVDRQTNFFEAGGNSLLIVRLANRIRDHFGTAVALPVLMQQQCLHEQAAWIDEADDASRSALVALTEDGGQGRRLFLLHPVGGHVLCYRSLAGMLPDFALYGLQAASGRAHQPAHSFDDMARQYADAICRAADGAVVHLGGWSMGAVLALAVARQLEQRGLVVAPLLLIDPWVASPDATTPWSMGERARSFFADILGQRISLPLEEEGELAVPYLTRCHEHLTGHGCSLDLDVADLVELFEVYDCNSMRLRAYTPLVPTARLYLARARQEVGGFHGLRPFDPMAAGATEDRLRCTEFDATHWTIMNPDFLRPLIDDWRHWLEQTRQAT